MAVFYELHNTSEISTILSWPGHVNERSLQCDNAHGGSKGFVAYLVLIYH